MKSKFSSESMDLPSVVVSFDRDAFVEFIDGSATRLAHWVAMPCPVGIVSLNDNRRPHPDHSNCQGGFIYTFAGHIATALQGNTKKKSLEDGGFIDSSSQLATFNLQYEDGTPFSVAPFDRFYIEEPATAQILIPMFERYVHSQSGIDKVKYPVESVQVLMDNRGEFFKQGTDFVVRNGGIVWTGTNRPAEQLGIGPGYNDSGSDSGAVCAIRYFFRPYYYVGQVLHDLRVAQIDDVDGRTLQRMPQQVMLYREYMSQDKQVVDEIGGGSVGSDAIRQMMASQNGGFKST
jgi:hypothetical protein